MKEAKKSRSITSNDLSGGGAGDPTSLSRAREAAYRILSHRDRTSREIASKLREKGFAEEMIEATLVSLKEAGYLDDARFARQWVRSRQEHRQFGPIRLKRELLEKGIPPVEVEAVLGASDENDSVGLAERALLQRFKSPALLQDPKTRQKAFAFLQRKGFPTETIFKAFKNFRAGDAESEA